MKASNPRRRDSDELTRVVSGPHNQGFLIRTDKRAALAPRRAEARYEEFLGMTTVIASQPMRRLAAVAARSLAPSSPVLITGESGTGKELIARAVHHYSVRAAKPFVDVNCAAIPEHLMESELFGYERGAFSGAENLKPGLFEAAHSGTLFLDEIGELDSRMQAKLLRVLDGQSYFRLGGSRKVAPDVRVVAATNLNLERRCSRADSGGTSSTGSTPFTCMCRRCGNASRIFLRWRCGFCGIRR